MAFSYTCFILQRVVLPAVLVLSALTRPVGISFVYLLMFFISPFVPVATTRNFKGSITAYLAILIAISSLLILCHIGLQVTVIALDVKALFGSCSFTEQLLRHIGFIDFRNLKPLALIEWVEPDFSVFIASLIVFIVTKKLTAEKRPSQVESGEVIASREQGGASSIQLNFERLLKISPLFCLATLFFAAVLRPSVPGGLYFLVFLLSGSYWATFKRLQRGFALILRFVVVVMLLHALCIVAYQTPWMQEHLQNNSLIARLCGLEPLIVSSCATDIRVIIYNTDFKLDSFFNPVVLLFSYYTLALTSKNLLNSPIAAKPENALEVQKENGTNKFSRQLSQMTHTSRGSKKDSRMRTQRLNVSLHREPRLIERQTEPTETTPLMRRPAAPTQLADVDIPLDGLENSTESTVETSSSVWDQISYGILSVGSFIYQNSYIFTNILMMAWSIIYHSWITFVLLLWANVLWMIPNQRKAMMQSSPFVVIYAELLIVAQYIYGMNLKNQELPSHVDTTGVNLPQIGLFRPQDTNEQPCIPLIVKTAFLLMFWVTLRQFFKEKNDERRRGLPADTTRAPFHIRRRSSEEAQGDGKKTSKFLKKAGDVIKNLLVRMWIWLLVLVIFLCAITGTEMTGFRICYMALFLFFLLVFQTSSKAWVKLMYGFWLFLIFYSMSILILIYTYQFDKFDQYWRDYLNISETLQTDIGLERFKTKDLFLHLVSPTLIVILTVIQVHYFHKRFIAALQNVAHPTTPSAPSPHAKLAKSSSMKSLTSVQVVTLGEEAFTKSLGNLVRITIHKIKSKSRRNFRVFKNVLWRILELHFIKAVYIAGFVCSVSQVCVLHVLFVILCVAGVGSRKGMQTFISRIMSLLVAIIILTKMIYQITYLDHAAYDVKCPPDNRTAGNNAVWFGLQKASIGNNSLMNLLRKYIIYMIMVTLHAVITLRQYQMRSLYKRPPPAKVLFPEVTRAQADENLKNMLKYLLNYGFFKFGLEISMIALVATITYRQDVIAVCYTPWLVVFLIFDRSKCSKLWGIFQCFVAMMIIIQYIVLVGLPPSLCLEYPWNKYPFADSMQRWAMLPGNLQYSHVSKLIFDFILLLIVHRQKCVFYIEAKDDPNYPGGSNKSVVNDIAQLGRVAFRNPTRDFLSHIRNYLDVIKVAVLCGFYWISLAMMFLAGTSISDFLAVGYLIGAFVFLWQGSDFYMRPIHVILSRWRWLLGYNVLHLVIKTCLQMAGCLFMKDLEKNCCWLVHILGINCASDPSEPKITSGAEVDIYSNLSECPHVPSPKVLVWDALCFAFLIFQLRIFKSHYFCHIIIDTCATNILASRGAEIIEDLRQKQIAHRQDHEREILLKIKRKMEKIRATQQKLMRPIDKPSHFDESEEARVDQILRKASFLSCQGSGYHTPDEADAESDRESTDHSTRTRSSSESSDVQSPVLQSSNLCHGIRIDCADALTDTDHKSESLPQDSIYLQLPDDSVYRNLSQIQPTTPSSEVLTMPLEGFLDMNRLSFGSAQNSDVIAPLREDSEESYEVFASPPSVTTKYGFISIFESKISRFKESTRSPIRTLLLPGAGSLNVNLSRGSSIVSSNLAGTGRHRRQSSINAVSWNETVEIKVAPEETAEKICADVPVTLRQKSLHRRHLSMGNASYSVDERSTLQNGRRRYSNVSWARDQTFLRAAARPNSWGPVESDTPARTSRVYKRKEIKLHPHAVRAGDYYMFEDVDDKFELDVIEDETDFLEDDQNITEIDKKMQTRKTFVDVWKDIQDAGQSRRVYLRQRSYASAPGLRSGIKFDGIDSAQDGVGGIRTSTLSEPHDYALHLPDEENLDQGRSEELQARDDTPSTSKAAADEEKKRDQVDYDVKEKGSDEDFNQNPIMRLLEGFMVSLSMRLNRFSRNYRYVNKILKEEKMVLKEISYNELMAGRVDTAAIFNAMKRKIESDESEDYIASPSPNSNTLTNAPNTTNHANITTTTDTTTTPTITSTSAQSSQQRSLDQSHEHTQPKPDTSANDIVERPLDDKVIRYDLASTHSLIKGSADFALDDEEFVTRKHNVLVEVLISTWYAILSNTDLICYIVVFINQVSNASVISLPLPIMVFLWGTLSLPRPTKTFWVTIIAYTQAVVLIKCICQYKLFWSNYIDFPNEPLNTVKIFGIELNPYYAIYDLLLLLALFFHRFILKSQGLWKAEYKEGVLVQRWGSETGQLTEGGAEDELLRHPSERLSTTIAVRKPRVAPSPTSNDADDIDPLSFDYIASIKNLKHAKYVASVRKFFSNLLHKPRLPTDVYALMFLCDFINFFVLLFGFTSFGSQQADDDSSGGGVQKYLSENKVPIPFLIMLLVQFLLIVIDRALYLRKAIVYKIIFHFISVIGIHIWMFFIIPSVTQRSFYRLSAPVVFYIIKCFYLLLSSYQIKCGYPKRILGNFLTKGFSLFNMILFKVYMIIPFLYELRTILDWVCTDTTMTLFDWLKMEDIFADIYFIKCSRQMETDFPAPRARKKALFAKLFLGGIIILVIVISIWGPMCLFALGNAVGQQNIPTETALTIRIGPYDPIYTTKNFESIIGLDESSYDSMVKVYQYTRALSFLTSYDARDVAVVKLPSNAPSMWEISPPDKQRLITDLKSGTTLMARFEYSFTHTSAKSNLPVVVSSQIVRSLDAAFPGRQGLIDMLEGTPGTGAVEIPDFVPKFVKVKNSDVVENVPVLMLNSSSEYRSLLIRINSPAGSDASWWEINENCSDYLYDNTLSKLPLEDCDFGLLMYTFNDKKFPSSFSILTAGGIIGLYTTFVLLASRILKSFLSGQNRKIMFEDLPYVDRVLQLCLDIYLVREALEFALEEDLFAKLIFLYRSPETMIKWTRPKEEVHDDDTDTESLRVRGRREEPPQQQQQQ